MWLLSKHKSTKIVLPFEKTFLTQTFLDLYEELNAKPLPSAIGSVGKTWKDFLDTIYSKAGKTYFFSNSSLKPEIDTTDINAGTNSENVLLGFSCGLDSVYQAICLKESGRNPVLFHVKNVNAYENGQASKEADEIAKRLELELVCANFSQSNDKKNQYRKQWAENPMKNQLILAMMVDYALSEGLNGADLSLGDDLHLSLNDCVFGINATDACEMTISWMRCLNKTLLDKKLHPMQFCPIKEKTGTSKLDRIEKLLEYGLQDNYYSCVQSGRFNRMFHEQSEKEYGVELFKHNCGMRCRKCAMHNLLLHYGGVKKFPERFIEDCWRVMWKNSYSADYEFFKPELSEEKRIENLFVY